MNSKLPEHVLEVCIAYEQGLGKGLEMAKKDKCKVPALWKTNGGNR